ncbi:MAG: Na+/H+ antiporter subunit E [Candidatus Izimaplasma sp.]|nr:Na+/H+ antiporter subunit E [Candidatus Izimaplasma bacterium]
MKYVATFLVLFVIYILLAGFVIDELILGALIAMILTLIIARYVDYKIDVKLPYRLAVFGFVYIPVFIWQLILSNIDVAKRVLSIQIPLNPGFVKIKTELKGDFAKLILANSITLTPGTLSVDIKGDTLYIHTVDVKGNTAEENKKHISATFEKILGVVFK